MAQITRLGESGFARQLTGSFASKSQTTAKTFANGTRLGLSGFTRQPYGDFSGKTSTEDLGQSNWYPWKRRRRHG